MSGRINLKSVRLKTAQKYSNWLLFYLFFQKQAPFSVPSVGEVAGSLITTRRVIFTPNVDIKDELQRTPIQITCIDRNGKIVKNVTSGDGGNVEDPDKDPNGGGTNGGGSGNTEGGGSGNTEGGGSGNTEGGGTSGGDAGGDVGL